MKDKNDQSINKFLNTKCFIEKYKASSIYQVNFYSIYTIEVCKAMSCV